MILVHTITLRNKFDALHEISEILASKEKCGNFNNTFMKAAAEFRPTKQEPNRVLWETYKVHAIGFQTFFVWALLLIEHT